MSKKRFDAIVIGAGLWGSSIAYHLSKLPYTNISRILLVEASSPAVGATSRSAGLLLQNKGVKGSLVRKTLSDIANLERELNESLGHKQVGTVKASSIDRVDPSDPCTRPLSSAELSKLLPWFQPPSHLSFALTAGGDGYVDPAVLAGAYLRAALSASSGQDVALMANTRVEQIATHGNKVTGLHITSPASTCDFLQSDIVIDATGIHSGMLGHRASPANLPRLPFTPTRSHYFLCTSAAAHVFPPEAPNLLLPEYSIYTRSDPGGMLLGVSERESATVDSAALPSDASEVNDWAAAMGNGEEELMGVYDGLMRIAPAFASVEIGEHTAGFSGYTIDGEYVIGRQSDEVEGLFVASGCNGSGLSTAGGVGAFVAKMVSGTLSAEEQGWARVFAPGRFGDVDVASEEFRRGCSEARANKLKTY